MQYTTNEVLEDLKAIVEHHIADLFMHGVMVTGQVAISLFFSNKIEQLRALLDSESSTDYDLFYIEKISSEIEAIYILVYGNVPRVKGRW